MKKSFQLAAVAFAAFPVLAAEPMATARIVVDMAKELRAVKPMNAVNNGPAVKKPGGDQKVGNFESYKSARIPFARLHDSINCCPGGAHAVDVSAVFPDFDADETLPESYDFVATDHYLDTIARSGTKIFYRLGQTIEHGPKKYGALPPKDYAKWARVCEHIVRHYNEGWGWGVDRARTTQNIVFSNQFNIVYWEIWNEPDLDPYEDIEKNVNPRCWGGTVTEFFKLYETAAKHLKAKFPELKIGGPAICGRIDWGRRFIAWCRDTKSPLDFFSWHGYTVEPKFLAQSAIAWRRALDEAGFKTTESILNEWNYVKGWSDDWPYSLDVESGRGNQKAAAFIAATMIDCQNVPLDLLMFYDAKVSSGMNCLFEKSTLLPMKGYYPFYAWARVADYGTEVQCDVHEGRGAKTDAATGVVYPDLKAKVNNGAFRAIAAKGANGHGCVFIARYSDDNNVTDTAEVTVSVPGVDLAGAKTHLTDLVRTYTEVPLLSAPGGAGLLFMMPNSFALIEF